MQAAFRESFISSIRGARLGGRDVPARAMYCAGVTGLPFMTRPNVLEPSVSCAFRMFVTVALEGMTMAG